MPSDRLGSKIAQILQTPETQRDRLTADIYLPTNTQEALGRLERAFLLSVSSESILKKIKTAIKESKLISAKTETLVRDALEAKIISLDEVELLTQAESALNDTIQVDSFTLEEYQARATIYEKIGDKKDDKAHLLR